MSGPWVCSVCGSDRIEPTSIQESLGDPEHPLGLCWECRKKKPLPSKKTKASDMKPIKHPLSPLCRPAEFTGKRRPPPEAKADDLFGSLPEDERKQLTRPVGWR